jgi:hypothetical protein
VLSYLCDKGAELGFKSSICEQTYMELCRHPGIPLHDVIGFVATRESFYNKGTLNSAKQILYRLQLSSQLAIHYRSFRDNPEPDNKLNAYPFHEVNEMLRNCLMHADQDIRSKS